MRCNNGMVNIIVLPLPGPANTIMSRPFKQCTTVRRCKEVGLTKPREYKPRKISIFKFMSLKLLILHPELLALGGNSSC